MSLVSEGGKGERKKEGAKSFCQCHLVGQAQIHEPEHWWLGKKRGILSGAGRSASVVSRGGSAPLAAFAGGVGRACLSSPEAALFTCLDGLAWRAAVFLGEAGRLALPCPLGPAGRE